VNRPGHDDVKFFYGNEVERTPAFGMPTLFVVGVQSVGDIVQAVRGRPHIFFGANHSFDPKTREDWLAWESMINHFLDNDFLCTLDIPMSAVEEFNEGGLCEYHNFIPQIRVSVPYTRLWNYNTMLKIDDRDFNDTNPGVWCHRLHDLMSANTFTSWREYEKDQPL